MGMGAATRDEVNRSDELSGTGKAWGGKERLYLIFLRFPALETSLVVQWLQFCAASAGGTVSIPGWGTKILHHVWHGQEIF